MTTTQTGTGQTVRLIDRDSAEAHSADLVKANIGRLEALFPDAFTEGRIDFEVLKSLLGAEVDEREEKYGLNWYGKRRARQLALTPSTGTLRPCPEESVDWDTTQNLMIEGDNLEVLKLLQKSYSSKVKLIYIDPPYNTGKDFVYPDNFQDSIKNYLELTGQVEGGQKISSNTDASGRFHTDWLNMMYPRLRLARQFLTLDGVMFISIDERELANLQKISVEVFGEENVIGTIVWKNATDNNPTNVAIEHEYLLVVARDRDALQKEWKSSVSDVKDVLIAKGKELVAKYADQALVDAYDDWFREHKAELWPLDRYKYIDKDGIYTGSQSVHNPGREGYRYDVLHPTTGRPCKEPLMGYRFPRQTMDELLAQKRILFGEDELKIIELKVYASEFQEKLSSLLELDGRLGAYDLREDFPESFKAFSNPKPVRLITAFLPFVLKADGDTVMDFFAGSGTTAKAALTVNAKDGVQRRFVLVQLPEPLDPNDKEQKAAASFCESLGRPKTISELTKERVRRASKKIKAGALPRAGSDFGFRVFKLAGSNIRAWNPNPDDLTGTLLDHTEHLVRDRSEQDVLYELLLKLGLDLAVPIETRQIAGKTVHNIGAGALMVCLSDEIDRDVAEPLALGIAQWQKTQAEALQAGGDDKNKAVGTKLVFKDSAFVDDVAKTNLAAILSQHDLDDVRSI